MKKFGYTIAKPRAIDLDKADRTLYNQLIEKVPSIKRCLMCGACSATCVAANHTHFNIRNCHLLFRHGQLENLAEQLDQCMLCGKCQLACPRGVNTRALIQSMRLLLQSQTFERSKL